MTVMATDKVETYPAMPWRTHMLAMQRGHDRWAQGQHVLIAAPTSAGKTTLASKLTPLRARVVLFVTKLKDPTFKAEFKGWTIYREWPKDGPKPWHTHVLLWPEPVKNDLRASVARQRVVFHHAINRIATTGNWCVVIDESLMFTDPKFIGLGAEIGHLHYFGRSAGISMVTLTQRPAWIPKVIYSSVTHAYVARTRDANDLKRLADLGGIDPKVVAQNVSNLSTRHDYLYLNPQGDAAPVIVNTKK